MVRIAASPESKYMTLRRRQKRRYFSLMHDSASAEVVEEIEKRLQDLYGTVIRERTSLKIISSRNEVFILRCTLGYEKHVLVSIALSRTPVITLDMSSSTRRLKRRLVTKVNTALQTTHIRG